MDTNAWISIGSIVVTVAAILAAPIVALRVSAQLQKRNTQEDAKLRLFSTLIETRHDALAPDAVRALNSIDLVFVNDLSVREAWSRYYVAIIDENLNNQVGWRIREERRRDLLLSMINAMNMANRISTTDLLRTYTPVLVGDLAYIGMLERTATIARLREELRQRGLPDPAPGYVSPSAPAPVPAPTTNALLSVPPPSTGDGVLRAAAASAAAL
jgi:hypothetical protein